MNLSNKVIISSCSCIHVCHLRTLGCNQPIKTQKPTSPIKIEKHPQDFELQLTNKNAKSHHHWTKSRKHLQEHQNKRKNSNCNKELNQAKGKGKKNTLHRSNLSQSQQASTTITILTNHASLTSKDGFSGIIFLPDA